MTKSTPSNNLYVHARVTQTLFTDLQQLAEADDRSLSSIIRVALKEYLKTRDCLSSDA